MILEDTLANCISMRADKNFPSRNFVPQNVSAGDLKSVSDAAQHVTPTSCFAFSKTVCFHGAPSAPMTTTPALTYDGQPV